MKEPDAVYREIPGYGGLYRINQYGEVQRVYKTRVVSMKPSIKKKQFIIRLMAPDGFRKEERVHKLMQRTFMPPPKPGQVLHHKNGNTLDNWFNNLGYITRKELGKATGGRSRRKAVVQMDVHREIVECYPSARQAAKKNHMSYQTVMDYCNGKVKKETAPDGNIYAWDDDIGY